VSQYRAVEAFPVVEFASWSEPENVRRQAYRRALLYGHPWRSLPLDGLLMLFGGPGAADLGGQWPGNVDLHVSVENQLLRRMFARFTGPDPADIWAR
jgi:hypothetical protein